MSNIHQVEFNHSYDNNTFWEFEYTDWGDVVREHIGNLSPKPSHKTLRTNLKQVVNDVDLCTIWKTTSYWRFRGPEIGTDVSDRLMCGLFDRHCLDVPWSNCVVTRLQYDRLHFTEPVYRHFNEDLLEMMGYTWSKNYTKIDRESLLRPERKYCFVLPGHDIWNMTPNRVEPVPHTESQYWKVFV
jgi:hypothetical protein